MSVVFIISTQQALHGHYIITLLFVRSKHVQLNNSGRIIIWFTVFNMIQALAVIIS